MITKRTVFVLGAGASQPYGFPLGPDLRHKVCMGALHPGDTLVAMGASPHRVHECRIALARSWASSIDMFIATRGDGDMLVRQAVALTLCQYENEEALFFATRGDWFRYLWTHLVTSEPGAFPTDLVSFITFNYDRSVEHALWNGLEHAYGKTPANIALRIPTVIHVYGSLGRYPRLPEGSTREFGFQPTKENIVAAAADIKAISQADRDEEHLSEARALLAQAEQIVFLGLAYDEASLALLGFERAGHRSLRDNCEVFGTAMGLRTGEALRARDCLMNRRREGGSVEPRFGSSDMDCLDFLRFKRAELFA